MSNVDLVDTHCHLNFHRYDADRDLVLRRARAAGVKRIIIPAIDLESCRQALDLAEKHDGLYVAVGIHPNSCSDFSTSSLGALRRFAVHERVVAIGEIGLDYYRDRCPKAMQQAALEAQLELAAELALPLIIHNREAGADLITILEGWAPSAPPSLSERLGVLHSFSASADIARRALSLVSIWASLVLSRTRMPTSSAPSPPVFRASGCSSKPMAHSSRRSNIAANGMNLLTSVTSMTNWRSCTASPQTRWLSRQRQMPSAYSPCLARALAIKRLLLN